MVNSRKRLLSIAVMLASLIAQSAVAENKKNCCKPCKPHKETVFCKKGTDITKLDLTPVNITVAENYPDTGTTINLVAKIASQGTGGKDVLFLHGFPHCHLLWKNQLKPGSKLRTQHNLYTLDFRGQGESDKPAPSAPPQPTPPPCPCPPGAEDTVYRPWQNAANDIHQTIVQLGLNKPVLVGHSLAAVFINDYLRMYGKDNEIGGILITGGLPDPVFTLPSLTTWFSPDFLALALSGDLESTDLERFIPATQTFVAFAQVGSPCKLAPNDLQEVLMYDTYVPGPTRFAIDCHDGLPPVGSGMPGPNDPVWAAVTVPTTIVHAIEDDIVLFSAGVHLSQVIPNAVLKPFKHSCHLLMLTQSKKFNKVLLNFLDSF